MHLRILDKYIFREVLLTFLFGICAFSAVFIGSGTLFKIAKYITDYGASLQAVVKIFIFGLPSVIMWTFPMSMLLASLLTFGRLSSSSEITAMKSCGISFGRIAAPAIIMGLIVSLCAIAFNEYVVPWANTAYRNVLYYEIQGNNGMKSQEHIILKDIEKDRFSDWSMRGCTMLIRRRCKESRCRILMPTVRSAMWKMRSMRNGAATSGRCIMGCSMILPARRERASIPCVSVRRFFRSGPIRSRSSGSKRIRRN